MKRVYCGNRQTDYWRHCSVDRQLCISDDNKQTHRMIIEALNGEINANERMLRRRFPAFSTREFGYVCFCFVTWSRSLYTATRLPATGSSDTKTNTSISCVMPVSTVLELNSANHPVYSWLWDTGCSGPSECRYTRVRGTPRRATAIQIERTVDRRFRKSGLLYCCHGTRAAGFKLSKPNLSPRKQPIFFAVLLVCFVH